MPNIIVDFGQQQAQAPAVVQHLFDLHGWYAGEGSGDRAVAEAPPEHGAKTVGQPYPNWTGVEWVMVNYSEPTPVAEVAVPAKRILTHLEFRRLFSQAERMEIDELEATFETDQAITPEFKKILRTGFKDFNASTEVDKDDPDIGPMLALFVSLGKIGPNRPAEILS